MKTNYDWRAMPAPPGAAPVSYLIGGNEVPATAVHFLASDDVTHYRLVAAPMRAIGDAPASENVPPVQTPSRRQVQPWYGASQLSVEPAEASAFWEAKGVE